MAGLGPAESQNFRRETVCESQIEQYCHALLDKGTLEIKLREPFILTYNLNTEGLNYIFDLFSLKHAYFSNFAKVDIFSDEISSFRRVTTQDTQIFSESA